MKRELFSQKVVLITGASSGIGEALAKQLAAEGAQLVLAARRRDRLELLADRLRGRGARVVIVPADVIDDVQCKHMIDAAIDAFGRLDVLVLNAGISTNARVQDLQLEIARRVMEVNYFGAVQPFLHAVPHLVASCGQVIVVSSLAGKKGLPTRAAYSASKFALHGFFDAARMDLRDHGVGVLIVCPGLVATEVRHHALKGDGSEQGFDDEGSRAMQSATACAAEILEAARAGKRELIMGGFSSRLMAWLNPFIPGVLDRAVLRFTSRR